MATLAALWTWGPLRDYATPARVAEHTRPLASEWWALPVAAVVYAVAALLFTPMTLLMVALVLMFGPWKAFLVAWCGGVVSAALGHVVGRYFWRQTLGRLVRERWQRVAEALRSNAVRSTIILRLIPVSPFTLVNLLAGSLHVPLKHFLLGTVVGVVPFLAILAFASDRIIQAVQNPTTTSVGAAALVLGMMLVLGFVAHRMARKVRGGA